MNPEIQSNEVEFKKIKRNNRVVKKMRLRSALTFLITIVVILGIAIPLYFKIYVPNSAKNYYKELANKYGDSLFVSDLPNNYNSSFGSLYRINNDVSGFLVMPGTCIDYPIVSLNEESDADYYETHLFNNTYNEFGTPYFTTDSNPLMYNPKNTVIKSKNSLMSDLEKYNDIDFLKTNPVIMMDTVFEEGFWKIIALYDYTSDMTVNPEKSNFDSLSDFSSYVEYSSQRSTFTPSCDVNTNDKLLTIMGTEGDDATVLLARKVRKGESISVDSNSIKAKNVGSAGLVCEKIDNNSPVNNDEAQNENTDDTSSNTSSDALSLDSTTIYYELPADYYFGSYFDSGYSNNSNFKTKDISNTTQPTLEQLGNLTVINAETGETVTDTYLNIISSIVSAEVGKYNNIETYKAQAIATYSYLCYYNTNSENHIAVKLATPTQSIVDAVSSVAGQVLTYNNQICCAQYFDVSAGKTTSCFDAFGSSIDYLSSVDSPYDTSADNYKYTIKLSSDSVKKLVKDKLDITLNDTNKNNWFEITGKDSGGMYVQTVKVGGFESYQKGTTINKITGRIISEYLFSYQLPSHAFEIKYDSSKDIFTFTSFGNGHGVGLSQYGANSYANQGKDYNWILEHYFQSTTLQYIDL